jgi:hypothetical protein
LLIAMARLVLDVVKSPSLTLLLAALFTERLRKKRKYAPLTVIFYPRAPHHRYIVWKTLKYMGAKMRLYEDVKRSPPAGLYVRWLDETFVDPRIGDELPAQRRRFALNERLHDISKRRVETVSIEVFGYGLMINPSTHCGKCVEKSNDNGRHDGRVIECPVALADQDKVYQRIINNSTGDGFVMDIRIPFILEFMPFAYLKYRPIDVRFSNNNANVVTADVKEILSSDEMENIKRFCNIIGLDIGELDLLRDNDSGKLYVIDVNSTPYGPPNHLGLVGSMQAIRWYAAGLSERMAVGEGSGT